MPSLYKLLHVFEDARRLIALPDNNFDWSSWNDRDHALNEIDQILSSLRSGVLPSELTVQVLFAPTGPLQEVSLSSGWGNDFIELSDRFDDAITSDTPQAEAEEVLPLCECFAGNGNQLTLIRDLGMDSRFAEASVLICSKCGQPWLRYFYEVEAFKGSGRWYLGAVTPEMLSAISAEHAKSTLEGLDWYFYGGSYYEGRNGRAAGEIFLNP